MPINVTFREPGFSEQRTLEPQIITGLVTDASGFPLTVQGVEAKKGRDRHYGFPR